MGLYGNEALKGLEGLGIVNEVRIYQDDDIIITVDGDGSTNRNFVKDPYFKYIKGNDPRSKEKIRIGFKDGEVKYIIHNDEKYELSSKERKKLNEIMDKQSNGNVKNKSVWDAILQATIEVSKDMDDKTKEKILSIEKPDFRKLK